MNITVVNDDDLVKTAFTGGECAVCNLVIDVNKNLPPEMQRNLVIHAVVENFDRGMPHDAVDMLTDFICDALDQLGGLIG